MALFSCGASAQESAVPEPSLAYRIAIGSHPAGTIRFSKFLCGEATQFDRFLTIDPADKSRLPTDKNEVQILRTCSEGVPKIVAQLDQEKTTLPAQYVDGKGSFFHPPPEKRSSHQTLLLNMGVGDSTVFQETGFQTVIINRIE
jgi:hypothetical protein